MLLDEDPATLIQQTILNFATAPDKASLTRISTSLSTVSSARAISLSALSTQQKRLQRTFNSLQMQHQHLLSSRDSAAHSAQIVELDTQKFRVAKAVSDAEIEGERLEMEVERLRNRVAGLEEQGVEGDQAARAAREVEDPVVLKLKVYRSLGIDIESDSAGNFTKATVRNRQKKDVHIVNIDPKFSRAFYANYFWSNL